jgi:purine-binding chemotaxis protein CheW
MKTILDRNTDTESSKIRTRQFATFIVDGRLYGIDVCKVQEVTKPLQLTVMRAAPACVKGLINLRGQIATAIGMRDLFNLSPGEDGEKMIVVCRVEDVLLSLLVDKIGDVIEVPETNFEGTPHTISSNLRAFMQGVYKTEKEILSVICLENILLELDKKCA